jgi:hypothetical protein
LPSLLCHPSPPAWADRRLWALPGRLRARTEEVFRRLMSGLSKLDHIPPPADLRPIAPAYDVATLKRQVAAMQVRAKGEKKASRRLVSSFRGGLAGGGGGRGGVVCVGGV